MLTLGVAWIPEIIGTWAAGARLGVLHLVIHLVRDVLSIPREKKSGRPPSGSPLRYASRAHQAD